jgi:hypothetical protein
MFHANAAGFLQRQPKIKPAAPVPELVIGWRDLLRTNKRALFVFASIFFATRKCEQQRQQTE